MRRSKADLVTSAQEVLCRTDQLRSNKSEQDIFYAIVTLSYFMDVTRSARMGY